MLILSVFRRGFSKGPLETADVYSLLCGVLRVADCNPTLGSLRRVDDVLEHSLTNSLRQTRPHYLVFLFILVLPDLFSR